MHLSNGAGWLLALALAACSSSTRAPERSPPPAPEDARGIIIDLFARYDVVGLPELHRSAEVHAFLRALVGDPRLVEHGVTNVVVEFGNARLQAVADQYVSGEPIAIEEVRRIWRDTGQVLVWDSPLYEEFFVTVRALNLKRPADQRLRVVLGDPPIDWQSVHSKADYEKTADRDLNLANIVETEVLAKHQKALVIAGGMHLLYPRDAKEDIPDRRRSAGDLLHRRHPDRVLMFWAVDQPIAALPGSPRAALVRGTPLAAAAFAPFAPKGIMVRKGDEWVPLAESDWPTLGEMADGIIHYAPTNTEVPPDPSTYRDAAYVEELRRRATVMSEVYGMDFTAEVDAAVAGAAP